MKTAKCVVQTAVDNSQEAVYINLQGLCPDLVDDVLRIEFHMQPLDVDSSDIERQMQDMGFSDNEIDQCFDAFMKKAKLLFLARALAERMT